MKVLPQLNLLFSTYFYLKLPVNQLKHLFIKAHLKVLQSFHSFDLVHPYILALVFLELTSKSPLTFTTIDLIFIKAINK